LSALIIDPRPIETRRLNTDPASSTKTSAWQGYRPFVVARRVRESDTISSFYLVPEDGQPLPPFEPGQYLVFRLEVPGHPEPVFRSYTLSDKPNPAHYRVTVKREPGTDTSPPGVSSGYFHDHVHSGTRLWVGAPRGEFCLDPEGRGPVALVSAGVGLTPMISMLNASVASGVSRPVWFIHSARNGREHAMGRHVRHLAREHDNVHAHISYSRPTESDRPGRDYDTAGRIDGTLLRELLPHLDFDFYLCGPPRFMDALRDTLLDWGVDARRIRCERFGAESAAAAVSVPNRSVSGPAWEKPVQVRFARSGVVASWDPEIGSLLDLAEAQGLTPESGCRVGICQICTLGLVDGRVAYPTTPAQMPKPGFFLPCCAQPITDVVVDL
jgi:ferredoxin-NADP reductase